MRGPAFGREPCIDDRLSLPCALAKEKTPAEWLLNSNLGLPISSHMMNSNLALSSLAAQTPQEACKSYERSQAPLRYRIFLCGSVAIVLQQKTAVAVAITEPQKNDDAVCCSVAILCKKKTAKWYNIIALRLEKHVTPAIPARKCHIFHLVYYYSPVSIPVIPAIFCNIIVIFFAV